MNAHGMKSRMSEFADSELDVNSTREELRQRVGAQSIADPTRTDLSKKEIEQMSANQTNGPAVPLAATNAAFSEAPVSWNTRYVSASGFECQLTLRGTNPDEVLKTATAIMRAMLAAGVHPIVGYNSIRSNGSGSNNNHAAAPTTPQAAPVATPAQAAELLALIAAAGVKPAAPVATSTTVAVFCPLHPAAEMKKHMKDVGDKVQIWYSHKLADGTWCRGA